MKIEEQSNCNNNISHKFMEQMYIVSCILKLQYDLSQ